MKPLYLVALVRALLSGTDKKGLLLLPHRHISLAFLQQEITMQLIGGKVYHNQPGGHLNKKMSR